MPVWTREAASLWVEQWQTSFVGEEAFVSHRAARISLVDIWPMYRSGRRSHHLPQSQSAEETEHS